MAVVHQKSTPVTNADAVPVTPNTAGTGGPAPLKVAEGYLTVTAAASIGATFQLVRVPSNAKIKRIDFESAAQAAGQVDIGVFYATDGLGGRPLTLLVSQAVNATLFATGVIVTGAVVITNVTNESGNYTIDKRIQPLWQAAGLTIDPGGSLDIVASVITADVTTGAAVLGATVYYTD